MEAEFNCFKQLDDSYPKMQVYFLESDGTNI